MNKFKAKPTMVGDIRFASKREANRFCELQLLERAGVISNLVRQPEFKFSIDGRPVLSRSERYPNGRQLKMVADFRYIDPARGKVIWEDSKGFRTKEFILKKAFFEAMNPGILLEEV
jgi:hypothetical protein